MEQLCPWEAAQYFIYSNNIPTLFFYSHIPAILVALLVGLPVFYKSGKSKTGINLLVVSILFSLWSIFDLIIWATNRPDVVLFFWSLQILVEPLVYLTSFYLVYLFVKKQDLPFKWKLLGILLDLPIVLLLASKYNLVGVDASSCNAIEGFVARYFTYIVELIFIISIILLVTFEYRKISISTRKKEIALFGLGITVFLIAFSSGNIIGSFTNNWNLAQIGLIGMPVFVGFLGYLIVKYKTFNIKLIAAQVLIWGLGILISAQFFFIRNPTNRVLNVITLIAVIIFGYFLVKAVKKESSGKEELQGATEKLYEKNLELVHLNKEITRLNNELGIANEKLKSLDNLKTEFLSLVTHQLRSPITAIIGYSSMLLDGSYGSIIEEQKDPVDKIFKSSQRINHMITRFLDVAKIEKGGMQYTKQLFGLEKMVEEIVNELSVTVQEKGLTITLETDNKSPYIINADREQLWQVVQNLVDNSMKYTKTGWIKVKLSKDEIKNKVILAVSDSGMGIKPEIIPTLFQKFNRGEGNKMNTTGSGLGLYLAKEIIEKGHQGKIWAESEGADKGSTFIFELESSAIQG